MIAPHWRAWYLMFRVVGATRIEAALWAWQNRNKNPMDIKAYGQGENETGT